MTKSSRRVICGVLEGAVVSIFVRASRQVVGERRMLIGKLSQRHRPRQAKRASGDGMKESRDWATVKSRKRTIGSEAAQHEQNSCVSNKRRYGEAAACLLALFRHCGCGSKPLSQKRTSCGSALVGRVD